MKAVILAGGKGTRLAPYTTVFPKPMLPIGEKPILEIIIKQLAGNGFHDITISVGYLSEFIQTYFANCHALPGHVSLTYVKEVEPLGTAGALSLIERPDDSFLVMNGDVLTTLNFGKFLEFHRRKGGMLTIATHRRQVKVDFGVISTGGEGTLTGYDEKPTLDYLVSMGVYAFEPMTLDFIEQNQRLDFPDLVKRLINEEKKVQAYPFDDYWVDIGRPDDYEEALKNFEEMEEKLLRDSRWETGK